MALCELTTALNFRLLPDFDAIGEVNGRVDSDSGLTYVNVPRITTKHTVCLQFEENTHPPIVFRLAPMGYQDLALSPKRFPSNTIHNAENVKMKTST